MLTPGQAGDAPVAPALLAAVPPCAAAEAVADRGYDSDALREDLLGRGLEPVIPPMAHRRNQWWYDRAAYRGRNRVERLVRKLKRFRGIATRYDKLAHTFLALVHLVAAFVMLC